YGYEINMKYIVINPLTADLTISYVRGLIKNSTNNLPMIPPLKGNLRLLYKYENWNFSISTEFADKQMQVDKFEEPTSGYIIFNTSMMYEFAFGRTYHQISLSAENIFNKIYRNHLSRIKSILPESGRNFKLLYQFYL
ncbi:MAG: TonB-dependent receptor, partial [Candidatus Kapaibacteriota bacterium]